MLVYDHGQQIVTPPKDPECGNKEGRKGLGLESVDLARDVWRDMGFGKPGEHIEGSVPRQFTGGRELGNTPGTCSPNPLLRDGEVHQALYCTE